MTQMQHKFTYFLVQPIQIFSQPLTYFIIIIQKNQPKNKVSHIFNKYKLEFINLISASQLAYNTQIRYPYFSVKQ